MSRLLSGESRQALREALFEKRAPCEGSRRNHVHSWWSDYGWRWPKWGVDIYGENEWGVEEYLFTLNNIGFIDSLVMVRVIKWSDRPLRAKRYYWWG